MGPIEANLDATTFAWFGPTEPLGGAYWRVVGPTVILEFSPQSNDGDPTDHAHTSTATRPTSMARPWPT